LREDDVSEVLARATVHHAHVHPIPDHLGDVLKLHVAAGASIVEPAVAVFADNHFGMFQRSSEEPTGAAPAPRNSLTRPRTGRTVELDTAVQYTGSRKENQS